MARAWRRDLAVTTRTYCTILSTNYLPKALALAESLRRYENGARLQILFIDHADDATLPVLEGVTCLSTSVLGLPRREVLGLAMSYDLVEFATAVKPLLLRALLRAADQVFYLDPDTYVTSSMVELGPALDASPGGILLTPHFLHPVPAGTGISDGHMLLVGVNNLGFCGVDQRTGPFLDWWWSHLRTECLYDPLAGLFVDQKWMDIGSSLFQATTFRHAGYNVGVANLAERPLDEDGEGYLVASTGDRLRLFHFHAFDSSSPTRLSTRSGHTSGDDAARRQRDLAALQGVRRGPRQLRTGAPGLTPLPLRDRYQRAANHAPVAPGLPPGLAGRSRPGVSACPLRSCRGRRLRALATRGLEVRRSRVAGRDSQVRAYRPARGVRQPQKAVPQDCRPLERSILRWIGAMGLEGQLRHRAVVVCAGTKRHGGGSRRAALMGRDRF